MARYAPPKKSQTSQWTDSKDLKAVYDMQDTI
jgi:hypothetical protein